MPANGNGLCSLAELEGFVLKELVTKYPKDKSKKDSKGQDLEYGKDLFDAFRPSYIRAFNDAKDYKADTGKVIEGTKKATQDDFVSFGEFKYFCQYLLIYGAIFGMCAEKQFLVGFYCHLVATSLFTSICDYRRLLENRRRWSRTRCQ